MRVLVTGHLGYIGTVMVPFLRAAGHDVVGLDTDFYAASAFAPLTVEVPSIKGDIRDVQASDLRGFDAVLHLAALSNDPLGNLDPDLTYDINHRGTVHLAEAAEVCRRSPLHLLVVVQQLWRLGWGHTAHRDGRSQSGDAVRQVQGAGRERPAQAGRRQLLADLHAQRDRLRRVAPHPVRHRAQQPDGLGGHVGRDSDQERRHAVAADRAHRGHQPGLPGRAAGPGRATSPTRRSTSAGPPRTTACGNSPTSSRRPYPGAASPMRRMPARTCGTTG